jgi:hypothetical protein
MLPEIDEAGWPIVKVIYPPVMTIEEIPVGAARLRKIFTTLGPMVTVSDISAIRVRTATPVMRKMVAEEANKLAAMGAFIAEATVIRNPVVRILHVGHAWLRARTNHPVAAFSDWPAALAWARACVESKPAGMQREPGGRPSPL